MFFLFFFQMESDAAAFLQERLVTQSAVEGAGCSARALGAPALQGCSSFW